MNKTITCPSGLSGEIRGLTGKAFELLTDRKLQRSGLFVDKILDQCWVQTIDTGPYAFAEGAKPDWQKVLVGDRFFAIMQVRCCLYGPVYEFQVKCGDCGRPINWTVDLEEQLTIRKLSDEDREAFLNGNRVTGQLPDGRTFTFKLPTGADERRAAQLDDQPSAFMATLISRIIEIEGVPEGGMRRFFEDADMSVMFGVLAEMDRHDCGVQTDFEVECQNPRCGSVQSVQIPFGQGFLVPKRARTGQGAL